MKIILTLIFLCSLTYSEDKAIFTKKQLKCLNQEIDRYLREISNPIFIILNCDISEIDISSSSDRSSINPQNISVNESNESISDNDFKEFTKDKLECIKKYTPKYLDSNKTNSLKIEIVECEK